MAYLLALIIPFLSFGLQIYPRIFNRYFGVDVWTRLIEIDHVRKAKHKIPGKITKGFIIGGFFDYPPLFPLIFSFFPKKFLTDIQGFVSPFFDSINNLLVFVICYQLTGNINMSLAAQAIYTLTPMIAVENSNLTPRSFGYTNLTLALFPLILYYINHNILFLVIGIFFASMLFLSHRFALQAFIFISIFFTFIDRSPIYIASCIIGFLLALILTRGYYLRVAKGHLYNIYFWVLNYKYRFAHQVYGIQKTESLDWIGKIYRLLSIFSPIFLLGINIWTISGFVYLFLVLKLYIETDSLLFKMSLWVIFFYLFGTVVLRVKRLIPIGEGQRYLEMATVPASILSSYLFFYFFERYGLVVLIIFSAFLFGNLVLILVIQIKGIIKDRNRTLSKELKQVFSYINKLPGTPRIICIPHQITTMTVYNTKADVLVNADNPGLMRIMDFYPVLKKSVKDLAKEYNLDYLLLRESFAKLSDLKIRGTKIVFESGDIKVIKLT